MCLHISHRLLELLPLYLIRCLVTYHWLDPRSGTMGAQNYGTMGVCCVQIFLISRISALIKVLVFFSLLVVIFMSSSMDAM